MKFLTTNAHWLLRIALASVFIYHGLLKFLNLEGFAHMLPISYLEVVNNNQSDKLPDTAPVVAG